MTFQEFAATQPSLAAIGRKTGHSRFYLSRVESGDRKVSRPLAVRVWREFGVKLAPFSDASDDELAALERFV